MKVLLFGKTRNVFRLPEDIAEDLRISGHEVVLFRYRNTKLEKSLEPLLLSPSLGAPLAALVARRMRRFEPDLVLGIGPFHWLPPAIFERLAAIPGRPPMIAWIGDNFGEEARAVADLFDIVAYADTGMLAQHERLGFRSTAAFIPLGATRGRAAPDGGNWVRHNLATFVGSATAQRRELLSQLREPVALFGPDWREIPALARHKRDGRRIGGAELAVIYRTHMSVLNMRNERNVVNGLNQRHFAPYVQGTPVITDPQTDLAHCFEPGKEILVYRNAEELNAILIRLRTDNARARAIGLSGRRRVLAQHTYAHRLATMAALAGIRVRP